MLRLPDLYASHHGFSAQEMDSDPFSTNASSQLSSGFKSAISTSPSEHRLHHKSHLARAHSEHQCCQIGFRSLYTRRTSV